MIGWIVLAAALGGLIRFSTEYLLPPVGTKAFPRATLIVNVAGSFVLGIVISAPHDLRLILGTGLCGALTTFSGVSLQLSRRLSSGDRRAALQYLGFTLALGLGAASLGISLGHYLF